MSPDHTLRPPETVLRDLRSFIVQVYAESQSFLAFMIGRPKSKIMVDAAFKLEPARNHIERLVAIGKQLERAAADCERYCDLSSRSDLRDLCELVAKFAVIQQKV
jgi:hypothetical protein